MLEDNPYPAALNGSLWTLKYEVMCYVGVFVAGVTGILRRRWAVTALTVALTSLVVAIPALEMNLPYRLLMLTSLGFPFALGMLLFVWRESLPLQLAIVLALAGLAAALRRTLLYRVTFTIAVAYGTFWLGCMQSRILQMYNHLGDYSYGMYIYAFPIQQIAVHYGATKPALNIVCAMPVALTFAVLSWTLVEKRALALRKSGGRRAQAPAQAQARFASEAVGAGGAGQGRSHAWGAGADAEGGLVNGGNEGDGRV